MKKTLLGLVCVCGLTLGNSRPALAAVFVNISDNLGSASCDNGTLAGVVACGANGFSTVLDGPTIAWLGLTVGGYTFNGASGVSTNVPGNSALGTVSDSKLSVTHDIASSDLLVDFGAYNFSLPLGPNLTFSASGTANWTTGVSTDTAGLQAWANSDNSTTIPGQTSALVPLLTTPGGLTTSDADVSPNVPFVRSAILNCFSGTVNCYSLVGRETIHQAVGTIASYQATETVLGTALVTDTPVPEPASLVFLGTGLIGLAVRARRRLRGR